jgi:hypothetical protein
MNARPRPGSLAAFAMSLVAALGAAGCLAPTGDGQEGATASTPPSPSASAVPSFVRPTPNPSPTFLVHVVSAGESLTTIARLFGTTARSIAYWNRDRYPSLDPDSTAYDPNRIVVGWTLRLIPTEVVDEDELPDPTPTPAPEPSPDSSAPSAGASPG